MDSRRGFTLIETLVVVTLLAIVFVAVLAAIEPMTQFKKSRDAVRKARLTELKRAIDAYEASYKEFPKGTWYHIDLTTQGGTGWTSGDISFREDFMSNLRAVKELTKIPRDPINDEEYLNFTYQVYSNAYHPDWWGTFDGFVLYTYLENIHDPDGYIYDFPEGSGYEHLNGQKALTPDGTKVMYLLKVGEVPY